MKNKRFIDFLCLFLSVGLAGCFHDPVDSQPPLTQESIVVHSGHVTFGYQNQFNKFRFKYRQYNPSHYEMVIYPLLSKPIILLYQENSFFLDMQGDLYYDDKAIEYLNSIAPHFPWEQLPTIVGDGSLLSDCWVMVDWAPEQGFLIEGQESSVQWNIKSFS